MSLSMAMRLFAKMVADFIKDHYQEMYIRWSQYSYKGFVRKVAYKFEIKKFFHF